MCKGDSPSSCGLHSGSIYLPLQLAWAIEYRGSDMASSEAARMRFGSYIPPSVFGEAEVFWLHSIPASNPASWKGCRFARSGLQCATQRGAPFDDLE